MRYTLFVVLTLSLTAILGWTTYRTAQLLRVWKPDRNLLLEPAENVVRLALVAVCIGLGVLSGLPAGELGWTTANATRDVVWGVVAGVLLSLVATAGTKAVIRRWGSGAYSPLVILNILPASRREWVLVLLALAPSVALEELLFRSLLLGGFSPLLSPWLLALGVSLAFGLMHLPQGRLGVAGTALGGLVLSLLFLWTGSLVAPLVAHYVADALQLVQASHSRDDLTALSR